METTIFVRGLVLWGIHGTHALTTGTARSFTLDIAVSLDSIKEAVETDSLEKTLDYKYIAACAASVIAGPPVRLIETLAAKIAATIARHPRAQKIKLTLSKCEYDDEMISGITLQQTFQK
ncbi:MAG TPA: dihydroneopterin aldolase [Candidatus Paceibacterota bacterium]|nr:dihydroneopterin aldolase [Candidatus Paceibacterota bacterium]